MMKKFTILVLVSFVSVFAQSQNSFINIYGSNKLVWPKDIAFNDAGDIFVSYLELDVNDPQSINSIIKLDSQGNLLEAYTKKDSAGYFFENTRLLFLDNELYQFGFAEPDEPLTDQPFVFLRKFDQELNELLEEKYYVDNTLFKGFHRTSRVRFEEDKFIYFSSIVLNDNLVRYSPFLMEISKEGELLRFVNDEESADTHLIYDYKMKPDNQGFYAFAMEASPSVYPSGWIYNYDNELNNLVKVQMPNSFKNFFTVKPSSDNEFYISGTYEELAPFNNPQVGVMKMTYDGTSSSSYLFDTWVDSASYTSYHNSLDYLSDGDLIMCSSYGIVGQYLPQYAPSWISLFRFSPDLELIWHRYIGGDANYEAYSMRVAPDDGIVITGGYSPAPPQNIYIKDLMIMKTDSDGLITGMDDEATSFATTEAVLFPNPAGDFVIVDFSLLYKTATLQLIDLAGRTVFERALTANHQQVNISGVPAGAYVYRIFNSKGLEESGKLVVE